jgi:hypothetical protein
VKYAYQKWPYSADTAAQHSQNKSREEKGAWLYNEQFQNRRRKQLTEVLAIIEVWKQCTSVIV